MSNMILCVNEASSLSGEKTEKPSEISRYNLGGINIYGTCFDVFFFLVICQYFCLITLFETTKLASLGIVIPVDPLSI